MRRGPGRGRGRGGGGGGGGESAGDRGPAGRRSPLCGGCGAGERESESTKERAGGGAIASLRICICIPLIPLPGILSYPVRLLLLISSSRKAPRGVEWSSGGVVEWSGCGVRSEAKRKRSAASSSCLLDLERTSAHAHAHAHAAQRSATQRNAAQRSSRLASPRLASSRQPLHAALARASPCRGCSAAAALRGSCVLLLRGLDLPHRASVVALNQHHIDSTRAHAQGTHKARTHARTHRHRTRARNPPPP